jgi:hypothetical protein
MACFVNYKGKRYSEPEFFALLAAGEYDKLVAEGKFEPKKLTSTSTASTQEEIKERNRINDELGGGVSQWLDRFNSDVVIPERMKELIAENNNNKTTLTNQTSLEQAQELINQYENERKAGNRKAKGRDAVTRIIEEIKNGELTNALSVAAAMIIFKNTAVEISRALKTGNTAKAEYFFKIQTDVIIALKEKGTETGRELQAFSLLDKYILSDPELADFYYRKKVEASNTEAMNNETNKSSANEVVDTVNKAKEAAKKKTAAAVVKDVNAALEKEMRKGLVNPTEAKKNQVKSFFNKLRVDETKTLNNKTFSAIIPINVIIDPKKYNKFIDGVEALVLGGMNLGIAITKMKAKLLGTEGYDEKQINAMQKLFVSSIKETQNPKAKTKLQLEREAANAEFKAVKEQYNAKQKEIKDAKEKARLADEAVQKILDDVERENFKRIVSEQEELKKQREKLAADKIKERQDLEAAIIKLEEKNQKALAAAEQKIADAVEKENFKRIVAEQNEANKKKKKLESDIDKLTKEILSTAKKSNTNAVEAIIDMFYSGDNQLQSNLEEMVVEALDVTPQEAVKIAEKIKNSMENELRSKLLKDLASTIKYAEEKENPPVAKTNKPYIDKFISAISTGNIAGKTTVVDKLIQLSMMGVLSADDVMNLVKKKYGMSEFTIEMAQFVKEQAKKISEATLQDRKNKEMAKLLNEMTRLTPLYYNDAMNSLWYASVLSGVGTQDANISYNIAQVFNNYGNVAFVNLANKIASIKNVGLKNASRNFLYDSMYSILRGLYQDSLSSTSKLGVGSSSLVNLIFGVREGVSSYAESEKIVSSQTQGEVDYSRLKKGMKFLNNTKYIGRMLSSVDLAIQDLQKNPWLAIMIREVYEKQGLDTAAIDAIIKAQLVSTELELEVANQKAVEDILKYDITIKEKDGKFIVMYNNSKRGIFDTMQEAEDAREGIAKNEGIAIKRWAYKYLQEKINRDVVESATHLSQESIMSSAPTGVASRWIYDNMINLKSTMTKKSMELEQESRASNSYATKYAKSFFSRSIYAAERTVAFVKMSVNLMNNFFVLDTPLGIWRAYSIQRITKNPIGNTQNKIADFYKTQTQIDALKSRAIMSTLAWAVPLLFTTLLKGKDDDDDEKKRIKAEQSKEIADAYAEENQDKIDESSPYLITPEDGEVFGALDFMTPEMKKSLENAGLAKEHSVYKGVYPNGRFVSIVSDPSKFNFAAVLVNTIKMYQKYIINDTNNKTPLAERQKRLSELIMQSAVYSMMSFGSFSINKRAKSLVETAKQSEGKVIDVATAAIETAIPEFQLANPNILKQSIRYFDGAAREMIRPSEDFTTYAKTKIPILGSFVSVYGATERFGMFGEKMYSVPAMSQGAVSQYYFNFMYGDKNKEYKEMYRFLASKGYNKVKSMPSSFYVGDLYITPQERDKLGLQAAKEVFEKINKEKSSLSTLPDKEVGRYVDKLFNLKFLNVFLKERGVYDEAKVKLENEKFDIDFQGRLIKQEQEAAKEEYLEVTPKEKELIKKAGTSKAQRYSVVHPLLETSKDPLTDISRYFRLGIISKEQAIEFNTEFE